MLTALIVTMSVLAHVAAASGTRYLIERLTTPDHLDAGAVTAVCAFVWPLALMGCIISWSARFARQHELSWKNEALASRKVIAERDAIIAGLKLRPPAQGVHR